MLQLTDAEKRDIVRYIEEGKELPEKYRFLLFENKRQVELLWNGKSDEVTNVVLPFQVIEQVDEPRSEKPMTMQEDLFDFSGRQIKGWTNKLIWGDNWAQNTQLFGKDLKRPAKNSEIRKDEISSRSEKRDHGVNK